MTNSEVIVRLSGIDCKMDELNGYASTVRDAVCGYPPGERDPILVTNLTAQSDLARHIKSRLAALIDDLKEG